MDLDASQEAGLLVWLGGAAEAEISNESVATNAHGRPIGFAFSVDEESGERGGVLVAIDLVRRPVPEGEALELELEPGPMEADLLHTSLRR